MSRLSSRARTSLIATAFVLATLVLFVHLHTDAYRQSKVSSWIHSVTKPSEDDPVTTPAVKAPQATSTQEPTREHPILGTIDAIDYSQAGAGHLGRRPGVDVCANFTMILDRCRGSYEGLERMRYVADCLEFLDKEESKYLYTPEHPASQNDPRLAECSNADGHDNTLPKYPKSSAVTSSSLGHCNGPIVPFHAYWSGPATWRVELLLKSYLHTQNLACSRFWLWVDSDSNPNAVSEMLTDPVMHRFLPLIARGDLILSPFFFPSRLQLNTSLDDPDRALWYSRLSWHRLLNSAGEIPVADGVVRDADGQEWLIFPSSDAATKVVASDAFRFIVLHLHGGIYLDMDVVLLKDLRPLYLANHRGFAERWGAHPSPGDYNTAILSLPANSSLSSYLLRGGVRMGMNFHPRMLGKMAWKDGRNAAPGTSADGLLMLETPLFDALWTELDNAREGSCTKPCLIDIGHAWQTEVKGEWEETEGKWVEANSTTGGNRTMDQFFRGTWTYHVHNQWERIPQPTSWLSVIRQTHDLFLSGKVANFYGEKWIGPKVPAYQNL